jgi:membrane dipeptidase
MRDASRATLPPRVQLYRSCPTQAEESQGKRASLMTIARTTVVTALLVRAIGVVSPAAQVTDPVRERARRLHRDAIVIDAHADLTPFLEKDTQPVRITEPGMSGPGYDASADPAQQPVLDNWTRTFPPGPWSFAERHADSYMDLPKLREGGVDGVFFAIYMDREPRPGMAVKRALGQIDAIRATTEKYSHDIALATTADEVRRIVASGRIAALMGLEGGYMIEDDIRVLRMFHALGVRYMTLTHSFNTNWGDSSGVGPPVPPLHGGLSPFGRAVVAEMNHLGMMVDLTHVADKTFYDALAVSKAPVILSHSSVDAIKEHPRNVSDDMLRALAKNGGVIHINAVIKYIDPIERPATPLSVFIDHVVHAIEVAGPDHVGIGIDYGYDAPKPVGLEDCSKYENITYELLKRGVPESTIRKVWGENTLRVMKEVERISSGLRSGS